MISYSKLLHFSCYELGHTWHPSCTKCSFEMFISSAKASLKIYAIVYLLTALVSKKKVTKSYATQLFKNYIQSVLFLAINGSAYVGVFCILRKIFRHYNYLTVSWLPSFIASFLAIISERQTRRSMLAIYVSNVASESFWNALKSRNYVRGVPHGEVLLFASAMALFGFCFKSKDQFSPMIYSVFKFVIGVDESLSKRLKPSQFHESCLPLEISLSNSSFFRQLYHWKYPTCPHKKSCFKNALSALLSGLVKGYLIQVSFRSISSLPKIVKKPEFFLRILGEKSSFRMAFFLAWFSASFKVTCCTCRSIFKKDKPIAGAYAGGIAGLGMFFEPSKSLAIYSCWKAVEILWNEGMRAGLLPNFPFGIEILYSFSTAYLFHLAVLDQKCLKPSYWQFLMTLSDGGINSFNRSLLRCYDVKQGIQKWPPYNREYLSKDFIEKIM